jgi:hypothetical protein
MGERAGHHAHTYTSNLTLMLRFWCAHHEDVLRVMQEKKTEEMMRESRRKDKAASTITRCIRNYGQMIRKGMGFTIRRQGLA